MAQTVGMTQTPRPRVYTSFEVCHLLNITHRKFDYWLRCGVIEDHPHAAPGSGNGRRFSESDLALLRPVAALMACGGTTERATALVAFLRAQGTPETGVVLVSPGSIGWHSPHRVARLGVCVMLNLDRLAVAAEARRSPELALAG